MNQMTYFVFFLLQKDSEYCIRNKKLQIFSLLQKMSGLQMFIPKNLLIYNQSHSK